MNATTAMKMNITFCGSPIPNKANVKRDQRGDRDVAAEDIDRSKEGIDPGKAAAEHAERNRDRSGQEEAQHHAPQADEQVASKRITEPEIGQLLSAERLGWAGERVVADDSLFVRATGEKPPEAKNEGETKDAEQNTRPLRNRLTEGKEADSAVAAGFGP